MRYMPLSPNEIPKEPGYLCAIDAEFVIMNTVILVNHVSNF